MTLATQQRASSVAGEIRRSPAAFRNCRFQPYSGSKELNRVRACIMVIPVDNINGKEVRQWACQKWRRKKIKHKHARC